MRIFAPLGTSQWLIAAGLGIAAGLLALIDSNEPGLTVDEPINVHHGKTLVWTLLHEPHSLAEPATIDGIWRKAHEHPPLTRLLVGLAHAVLDPRPDDPAAIVPKLGRPASAVAFAGIVFLCTLLGWRILRPASTQGYAIHNSHRLADESSAADTLVTTTVTIAPSSAEIREGEVPAEPRTPTSQELSDTRSRSLDPAARQELEPRPPAPSPVTPPGDRISRTTAMVSGISAGIAAVLMPRLFGHAHFASPEVISGFFFLLGLATATWAFSKPAFWRAAFAGIVLGLALLTKLTVILLPLSVTIVALWSFRWRAIPLLVVWGLVGLSVFIAGWPWLWPIDLAGYSAGWHGTAERVAQFLGVAVARAPVFTYYFGQQYPNEAGSAPWHYCWTYFLATVPIGLQLVGIIAGLPICIRQAAWPSTIGSDDAARETPLVLRERVAIGSESGEGSNSEPTAGVQSISSRCDSDGQIASARMLVCVLLVILSFFSLPIPRYDGERLFLMVFPVWAIVIGVGIGKLYELAAAWLGRWPPLLLIAAGLATQAQGLTHSRPYYLSYYNHAVGGLAGAHRLGLEVIYWGDSLTDSFLNRFSSKAKEGECAALLPTLFDGHAVYLMTPEMNARRQSVAPGHESEKRACRWAILFHRQSYLGDPGPKAVLSNGRLVDEVMVDGVWLSRLYELEPK